MKQQIYFYELELFSQKKDDPEGWIELSQEQGQQLVIALASNQQKKFVVINDDVINTSAIKRLTKYEKKIGRAVNGDWIKENEIRELTGKEKEVQKLYDKFKGQKLLE